MESWLTDTKTLEQVGVFILTLSRGNWEASRLTRSIGFRNTYATRENIISNAIAAAHVLVVD